MPKRKHQAASERSTRRKGAASSTASVEDNKENNSPESATVAKDASAVAVAAPAAPASSQLISVQVPVNIVQDAKRCAGMMHIAEMTRVAHELATMLNPVDLKWLTLELSALGFNLPGELTRTGEFHPTRMFVQVRKRLEKQSGADRKKRWHELVKSLHNNRLSATDFYTSQPFVRACYQYGLSQNDQHTERATTEEEDKARPVPVRAHPTWPISDAQVTFKVLSFLQLNEVLGGVALCNRGMFNLAYDSRYWRLLTETQVSHVRRRDNDWARTSVAKVMSGQPLVPPTPLADPNAVQPNAAGQAGQAGQVQQGVDMFPQQAGQMGQVPMDGTGVQQGGVAAGAPLGPGSTQLQGAAPSAQQAGGQMQAGQYTPAVGQGQQAYGVPMQQQGQYAPVSAPMGTQGINYAAGGIVPQAGMGQAGMGQGNMQGMGQGNMQGMAPMAGGAKYTMSGNGAGMGGLQVTQAGVGAGGMAPAAYGSLPTQQQAGQGGQAVQYVPLPTNQQGGVQ